MAYNTPVSIDYDYHGRLDLLCKLMQLRPNKPVRKLLREALKYYPLSRIESQRNWLSIKTAFKAAEILNKPIWEQYLCKHSQELST